MLQSMGARIGRALAALAVVAALAPMFNVARTSVVDGLKTLD